MSHGNENEVLLDNEGTEDAEAAIAGEDANAGEDAGAAREHPRDAEPEHALEVKVVDKRRFKRFLGFGGASDADPEPERERLPSFVEQLKQRAEAAEAGARAEVEAARARLERHFESRVTTARAEMAAGLLDVLDNLDRALSVPGAAESPLFEGVTATRDVFVRKLGEMGVVEVPGVGEPFDPEIHEAIDEADVADPAMDGRIAGVLQRGFRTAERLVRPAFVRVGRYHGGESGDSTEPESAETSAADA